MKSLKAQLRDLGQADRHTLPAVAITIAKAAKDGQIDGDDAHDAYADYYMASAGVTTVNASDPSVKVNVSKMRQIILAADPELLGRVAMIHKRWHRRIPCKPLYHAMVDVCRFKLTIGKRRVSDTTIKKLVRRP